MRIETVSLDLLIPIEYEISSDYTLRRMFERFTPERFLPIPVIDYPEREKLYLMGDGHHRATYCYLADLPARIKVLETDEDVYKEICGAFRNQVNIDSFISAYETDFRKDRERKGVFSIKDLVENQAREDKYGFIAKQLLKKNAQSRTPHPHQ